MQAKLKIILIFAMLVCAGSSFAQVVVIANKSVPVDTLAKTDVLDLYTGDIRKWSDGQAVVVMALGSKEDVSRNFYQFLDKSPSRMKSIWLKKMLSGEGDPPEIMKSEEELVKKVAATPGAIGYIRQTNISPDIKVLMAIEQEKTP